jgi:uncharacterized delta-60 repeat protein
MRSRRHRRPFRSIPTFFEPLEHRRLLTATLASVNPGGVAAGNAQSIDPSISADGRFVVFASNATDLVPGFTDANGAGGTDVYLRDRQTGTTTLVSHNSDQFFTGGDGSSQNPVISADGNFIAYESDAGNLGGGDGLATGRDVFYYDVQNDSTQLISGTFDGMPNDGPSTSPSISADGAFVAFASTSGGIVDNQASVGSPLIYLRDIQSEGIQLVSRASDGTPIANDTTPTVSNDGRFVAYVTTDGVAPGDGNGVADVYVFDAQGNTTTLVSHGTGGLAGNGPSRDPVISGDGSTIAFDSDATNLVTADTTASTDVLLYNVGTGVLSLASVNLAGTSTGNGPSKLPSISTDGRFVAFSSTAGDLLSGTAAGAQLSSDVFVRDTVSGTTSVVSLAASGAIASGPSDAAAISADGSTVAFHSLATDLDSPHVADSNNGIDVFVAPRVPTQSTLKPGEPNTNFGGGDGLSVIDPPGPAVKTVDTITLPDGRILAAAYTLGSPGFGDVEVIRFKADGTIDPTFGTSGVATLDIRGTDDFATAIITQPDGKILVSGSVDRLDDSDNVIDSDIFVARFTADGDIDTSFGAGDGVGVADFADDPNTAPTQDHANDLALASDGKIVLVGWTSVGGGKNSAVYRFNADGTIDTGFGFNGLFLHAFGGDDVLNAVTILPDGRIAAAGSSVSGDLGSFLIARFGSNGANDPSFANGKAFITVDFGAGVDEAHSITLDGDSMIAGGVTTSGAPDAAGFNADFAVTRIDTNGNLDTTFGSGGKGTVDFGGLDAISKLIIQPGGKLVASGFTTGALSDIGTTPANVAVARFNADGTLDTGFSDDGKAVVDVTAADSTGPSSLKPLADSGGISAQADATLEAQFDQFLAESQGLVTLTQGGGILLLATQGNNVRLALLVGDAGAPTVAIALLDNVTEIDVASIDFRVQYSDDLGVDTSKLGTGDILVTGPNGFSQQAAFVQFEGDSTSGTPRVARYRITPASGSAFTEADDGAYALAVQANRIADVSGNFVQGAAIPDGTFTIAVPSNVTNLVAGPLVLKLKSTSVIGGSKAPTGSISVKDDSPIDASGTVTISVVASTDDTFDGLDVPVATIANQKVALKPGKSKNFKLKLGTFPSGAPDDDYFLLAKVDSGNAIPELKKSDNVGATAQKVTIAAPFIDLLAPAGTLGPAPAQLTPSLKFSFAVAVQNAGNTAAKATTDVKLYASNDTTLDAGDTALTGQTVKLSIKPGATKNVKLKLTLPATLPPAGNYFLILNLDDLKAIAESNETNNAVATSSATTIAG